MKRFSFILVLCALAISASAERYVYNCGITSIKVDTLQKKEKNQFTITFTQKYKNLSEYNKPTTCYKATIKLVLNSDDRTLDGVYSTENSHKTDPSANENDQTINLVTSEFTSGSTSRALCKDSISTFTIEKVGEGYAITSGRLIFSQRVNQVDTWVNKYSYDAEEILKEGIQPKPFYFDWKAGYFQKFYHYDIAVTGLDVKHENSAYDATRYFLTLQCKGTERETQETRNYEIAVAIYPQAESIVGTFATQQSATVLMAMDSYVKDMKLPKTRYLANDSISSIQIKNKGTNKYSFYGGTLICIDQDANYSAVYGKKRIEAAHYYHFSDYDGDGLQFSWDESTGTTELITPVATGLENVQNVELETRKIIRDGKLIILRDGKEYNALGAEL